MAFELSHTLFSKRITPRKQTSGETVTFKVSEQGQFSVLFAGKLFKRASATFTYKMRVEPVGPEPIDGEHPRPGSTPLHGGWQTTTKHIPLKLRIFTPDGNEFSGDEITVADLKKHRDLRGRPSGNWSYKLSGESEPVFLDEESTVGNAKGSAGLALKETIHSESAAPLIPRTRLTSSRQTFEFDLFRVGTFVADISGFALGGLWRGSMRLLDPDGVAVAQSTHGDLSFKVELRTLGKSRDAQGKVRKWTLEVLPQGGITLGNSHLSATVIGSGRITIAALRTRIEKLLGPHGEFIKLYGENKDGKALGRLMITDVVSAETIEMHDLLDGMLDEEQDSGVDPNDIRANTVYTIGSKSQELKAGLKLDVSTLKVKTIDVSIGPGVRLGAQVPCVRLAVAVSGEAKIKFGALTLATGKVRGGKVDIEVGMKLGEDGTPQIVTAMPDSVFDIDISTAVKVALVATLGIAGLIGGMSVTEYVESEINEAMVKGARRLFADPTIAPRILMTIFGAHLTYKPIRIEGEQIVFDHIAPLEPDPKPTPGYQGAIGRSFTQLTPGSVSFMPHQLSDTWRADNLQQKIDHIVVVMMENRSYDHVLGYRARAPFNDGADGLSDQIISSIEEAADGPFDVRALREAGFPSNAVGKKTRLPKGVGHELDDVAQQLSVRTGGPGGRQINSPKGFVDNFKPRLNSNPQGVVADDVLGYYDHEDLPMFAYLAENYAYCDTFFCSHPGPTLPNRMYSLTGDVQHDRYGFPILDNNNSDNFLLSRAPTIYDFLARRGLSFRVYESMPSVTMLRMFARYATDTTNIVPLDRLEADVRRGDLPAFTAIEPQMHAHPQDDDHPDADMHRGQIFLKRVYDTLRLNPALWQRTLLVVTYDEHGGLYDHVIPPAADVLNNSREPVMSTGRSFETMRSRSAFPTELSIGTRMEGGLSTAASGPLTVPYGVRVPTFIVSPWTMRGKGPSLVLDHCSILKSVLARFWGGEKPFLSDRVNASQSFEAFLSETSPRMNVPASPTLDPLPIDVRRVVNRTSQIETEPLSRKEMREGPVDYHRLSGRWARQLGR